jgi:hypothetical protein
VSNTNEFDWDSIKICLVIIFFAFIAGIVVTHLFYWYSYPEHRDNFSLANLTVLSMKYRWSWFLLWAAFLAGICIVRNTVTGKKQTLILEKAETEARQKIAAADQYQKDISKKCDFLLLENDNICKKKREYDLIEIKTLRTKIKKMELLMKNTGRFKREHKMLWRVAKQEIENEEKMLKSSFPESCKKFDT